MLVELSIRDIVLIEKLDIAWHAGLCALTGETGAGKSILLDALGLALGFRAAAGLVRHGADQGSVTAEFDVPADHPARRILCDLGLPVGDTLALRRVLGGDGRSRAFLDDQPVSIATLRQLGESLVEFHVQGAERGLLDPAIHRGLLDEYGGLGAAARKVRSAHDAWRAAEAAAADTERRIAVIRADEDYLRHALGELAALDPKPDEEAELAENRAMLMNAERLLVALETASASMADGGGVETRLLTAKRALDRIAGQVGGRLDAALQALERAALEAAEADAALAEAIRQLDLEPSRLEQIEERLFALRALARKHATRVDQLAEVRDQCQAQLASIEDGAADLAALQADAARARDAYLEAANGLSAARSKAARRLDRAVATEFTSLRLDTARFRTDLARLADDQGGADGLDRTAFLVATIPETPLAPLARIASGGELSRFRLALRVVLANQGTAPTLIFDEVDRGIGGATADAVGERLARLAADFQVLVVTHSPQVAARADHHWLVSKRDNGKTTTTVDQLDAAGRGEEIARMLAGAEVTREARAAARSRPHGQGR